VRTHQELLTYVGKESNKLEEVETGLEHDPDGVYTENISIRTEIRGTSSGRCFERATSPS
jgi:hypothetical protein